MNNFSLAITVALGLDLSTSSITTGDFLMSIAMVSVSAFALYYIANKRGWFDEKTNENILID